MDQMHPEERAWNRRRRERAQEEREVITTLPAHPEAAKMCGQAAAMLRAGPDVVQYLITATTPAAVHPVVRPPQLTMDFGQQAAYQMGQASVVGWLIEHGTMEVPDGDPGVR